MTDLDLQTLLTFATPVLSLVALLVALRFAIASRKERRPQDAPPIRRSLVEAEKDMVRAQAAVQMVALTQRLEREREMRVHLENFRNRCEIDKHRLLRGLNEIERCYRRLQREHAQTKQSLLKHQKQKDGKPISGTPLVLASKDHFRRPATRGAGYRHRKRTRKVMGAAPQPKAMADLRTPRA